MMVRSMSCRAVLSDRRIIQVRYNCNLPIGGGAQSLSPVWLFVTPVEIFQARILEHVAISFSRGSSLPRDQTQLSCISCTGRWVLYQLRLSIIIHKELEKSMQNISRKKVQNISSTSMLVTVLWMKKLQEIILNSKYFYEQVTKT